MSTEDSGTPHTAIYTRIGREQGTPETSEAQREAIQRFAQEHGYEVLPPRAGEGHGRPCPDCGVMPGRPHEDGCDVARCLATGRQRLSCPRDHEAGDLDCGWDIWTGEWPGDADAIRLGWYSKFTDRGWVRCGADDPEASPDMNRLHTEAQWNRETGHWELPGA